MDIPTSGSGILKSRETMGVVRVIACAGAREDPQGPLYEALVSAGHHVVAPDYRGLDLATASDLTMYQVLDDTDRRQLLVGHSFGGAVALLAALQAVKKGAVVAGLVLCAPAVFLAESLMKPERFPCPVAPTVILHGIRDTVIPIELSRGFCREHDLPLIEVNDDHALLGSLDIIVGAVASIECQSDC